MVAIVAKAVAAGAGAYGTWLAKYPGRVLGSMLLLLFAAGIGGLASLSDVDDAASLFVPEGSIAQPLRERYQELFGNDDVYVASVIVSSADGSSVLDKANVARAIEIHAAIAAGEATAPSGLETPPESGVLTLSDVCLMLPTATCYVSSVLRCLNYDVSAFPDDATAPVTITSPMCLDPFGFPVFTDASLGADTTVVDPGLVTHSSALRSDYFLKASTADDITSTAAWEGWFMETFAPGFVFADGSTPADHGIEISVSATMGIAAEMVRGIDSDQPLLLIAMCALNTVVTIALVSMKKVHARGLVGVGGSMLGMVAIVLGLGWTGMFGIPSTPFLSLSAMAGFALYLHGMFVLQAGLTAAPASLPIANRIGVMLATAAVPLISTAVAAALALFTLAAMAPYPGISYFCSSTALVALAALTVHLTLYAPLLALDAYREADGRRPWLVCLRAVGAGVKLNRMAGNTSSSSRALPETSRASRDGGRSSAATAVEMPAVSSAASPTKVAVSPKPPAGPPTDVSTSTRVQELRPGEAGPSSFHDRASTNTHTSAGAGGDIEATRARITRGSVNGVAAQQVTTFALVSSHAIVRGFVMSAFIGVLCSGIYGLTSTTADFSVPLLVPQDSFMTKFDTIAAREYNTIGAPAWVVVDGDVPYWEPETQATLMTMVQDVSASESTPDFPPCDFWLTTYLAVMAATAQEVPTDEPSFIMSVMNFLTDPTMMRYRLDLALARPDGTLYALTDTDFSAGIHIAASRAMAITKPMYTAATQTLLMLDISAVVATATAGTTVQGTFVYSQPFHIYEQQIPVVPVLVLAGIITVAAVCMTSIIMLPGTSSYIFTTLCFAGAEACGMGFAALTPVAWNTLTMANGIVLVIMLVPFSGFAMVYKFTADGFIADMDDTDSGADADAACMGGVNRRDRALLTVSTSHGADIAVAGGFGIAGAILMAGVSSTFGTLGAVMLVAAAMGYLYSALLLPSALSVAGPHHVPIPALDRLRGGTKERSSLVETMDDDAM